MSSSSSHDFSDSEPLRKWLPVVSKQSFAVHIVLYPPLGGTAQRGVDIGLCLLDRAMTGAQVTISSEPSPILLSRLDAAGLVQGVLEAGSILAAQRVFQVEQPPITSAKEPASCIVFIAHIFTDTIDTVVLYHHGGMRLSQLPTEISPSVLSQLSMPLKVQEAVLSQLVGYSKQSPHQLQHAQANTCHDSDGVA